MEFLIALILVILIYFLAQYNGLVKRKNRIKQARSGIDVYLNQRFDLIPNLVETVKGYMTHEKDVLIRISEKRSAYMNSQTKDIEAAAEINNECNHIMMVAESYPELKASEHFLQLQKSLTKMENQLQAARRIYNGEVTRYNIKVETVPSNIIANIFGFKTEKLFEIEEYKAQKPDINI